MLPFCFEALRYRSASQVRAVSQVTPGAAMPTSGSPTRLAFVWLYLPETWVRDYESPSLVTLVLSLCPLKQRHKNASKRRSVEGPRQRVGSQVSRLFSSPPAKRRSWTLLFPLCKPPSKLFRFFLHDRKKKKKTRYHLCRPFGESAGPPSQVTLPQPPCKGSHSCKRRLVERAATFPAPLLPTKSLLCFVTSGHCGEARFPVRRPAGCVFGDL